METIKLGLDALTDEQKVALINDHIAKLNGNANFPTPEPSVAEFAASTAPYVATVTAIAQLDAQRKALLQDRANQSAAADVALTARAGYVTAKAKGDGAIMISAGFTLAKPRGGAHGTLSLPPTPSALAVTMSAHVGTLHAIWHAQKGYTWAVQVCPDPLTEANFAQVAITSHSTVDISGLTTGTKYWARVAAIKGGIQGDWCQPLMCMAP